MRVAMRPRTFLLPVLALVLTVCLGSAPGKTFIVEPYWQLGNSPHLANPESMVLMWHTTDAPADWAVEIRNASGWIKQAAPAHTRVAVGNFPPYRIYRATVSGLTPGSDFEYRVLRGGSPVFAATARARKAANQSYRFAVFGDCGAGSAAERAIAYQAWRAHPDFVFIPGDIVYMHGRGAEYRENFFPIYNAGEASPKTGAPLLRSILFTASLGNHDAGGRNLDANRDGLAYFLYWAQPLNGPSGEPLRPEGTKVIQDAFLAGAGEAFPRMANFSFDYGNSHWLVLDSGPNVNWNDAALRQWVINDLAGAKGAAWRFVGFHHPGFSSSRMHFGDQQMRVLSEVFEAAGVDVVFAGHVHNYQRSYPLTFMPKHETTKAETRVAGAWKLDKSYDGMKSTRAHGVIYIVDGAGGAGLYDGEQQNDRPSWRDFTVKFISLEHTLTVAEVTGNKASFRQISQDGLVLDAFTVTK